MVRTHKREERTDTGYRIHSESIDANPFSRSQILSRGVLRGVHLSYERSLPKVLYDSRVDPRSSPMTSVSLWEQVEARRRNRAHNLRTAWAKACLEDTERTITRREARRLATLILSLPDPRTVDAYEKTMFDAQFFEITLDGDHVHLLTVPYELAHSEIAPDSRKVISESMETATS